MKVHQRSGYLVSQPTTLVGCDTEFCSSYSCPRWRYCSLTVTLKLQSEKGEKYWKYPRRRFALAKRERTGGSISLNFGDPKMLEIAFQQSLGTVIVLFLIKLKPKFSVAMPVSMFTQEVTSTGEDRQARIQTALQFRALLPQPWSMSH